MKYYHQVDVMNCGQNMMKSRAPTLKLSFLQRIVIQRYEREREKIYSGDNSGLRLTLLSRHPTNTGYATRLNLLSAHARHVVVTWFYVRR